MTNRRPSHRPSARMQNPNRLAFCCCRVVVLAYMRKYLSSLSLTPIKLVDPLRRRGWQYSHRSHTHPDVVQSHWPPHQVREPVKEQVEMSSKLTMTVAPQKTIITCSMTFTSSLRWGTAQSWVSRAVHKYWATDHPSKYVGSTTNSCNYWATTVLMRDELNEVSCSVAISNKREDFQARWLGLQTRGGRARRKTLLTSGVRG